MIDSTLVPPSFFTETIPVLRRISTIQSLHLTGIGNVEDPELLVGLTCMCRSTSAEALTRRIKLLIANTYFFSGSCSYLNIDNLNLDILYQSLQYRYARDNTLSTMTEEKLFILLSTYDSIKHIFLL